MYSVITYSTVPNPNIPVLTPLKKTTEIELAKFIETPIDARTQLDADVATVKTRDMYLPNFSLREFKGSFKKDTFFINTEGEGLDLLGSCIFFKATIHSFLGGQSNGIWSHPRTQNFKYDPHNEIRHWVPAESPLHFLHVSYTVNYFNQLFAESEPWSDAIKSDIHAKKRIMGERGVPITVAQEHALQIIYNCPLSGKLGESLIEASLIQVLLLQLHALFNKKQKDDHGVAKRDFELIQGVREYLEQTFLQDHSIAGLSKLFGTNTNKLMSLFKKVIGKSIFEYISGLRMEHATHLLQDKDHQIVEVARILGYKNPNHFSTAFRKKYGVSPSEY
ncbi:MAG: helix-turn-helix transcriptional regulator [Cyclobacteriaceae bacterium]|nr:helix-turn-helix transcriptional regulator [Cyclobacteriaceae bacterium]